MNAPEVAAWKIKPCGCRWVFGYKCPVCGSDLYSPVKQAGNLDNCPDCGGLFTLPLLTNEGIASCIDEYQPKITFNIPGKLLWIRFIPLKLHFVVPLAMGLLGAAVSGENVVIALILAGIGLPVGLFLQVLKYEARSIAYTRKKENARLRGASRRGWKGRTT